MIQAFNSYKINQSKHKELISESSMKHTSAELFHF